MSRFGERRAVQPFINPEGASHSVFRKEFAAKDGAVVVFREPTRADAKAMMRFINSVIRETRSGVVMDRPVTLKGEDEWLKARLDEMRRRSEVMLVAEADGKIVGNCHISRRMWKERHRALIGVVLSKAVRGKGIGKAIMTECMHVAEKRMSGIESFELDVLEYNKAARMLYERLGFVEVSRMPDAVKEDGRYIDESTMVLRVKDKGRGERTKHS